jgi:leucyl-tRNA---protein transferase
MQLQYGFAPRLQPSEYLELLKTGWRRMGPVIFRADCPGCCKCLSLRIPADSFRPSRTQRRILNRNTADVGITIAAPTMNAARVELFKAFHEHGHQMKGWPAPGDNADGEIESRLGVFLRNPFPTEEWTYWIGDRLVGVGYVDALAEGLSAIYFFHDPREHRRSLGTFNVLKVIEAAGRRGLPHVYLGYYVEGCRSLEYKARFRPNEVLSDGGWQAFAE